MKTIIAGSRHYRNYAQLEKQMETIPWKITEVVSGMAVGADTLGQIWAVKNNLHVASFYPQWQIYHKKAGPIRNGEMAQYAEACIVFWDGKMKHSGSRDMINKAITAGLVLKVFHIEVNK